MKAATRPCGSQIFVYLGHIEGAELKTDHPIVTVSSLYIFHVLAIVEDLGLIRDVVIRQLGVDIPKQPNPKTRYSLEFFDKLLSIAARELGNPHLGLSTGEKFRIATYTDLGNILAFCKDIEEAAYINKRYSSLVHTLGVPHVRKETLDGGLKDTFIWEPNFPKSEYQKFYKVTEFVIANYVTSLNWLAWGFGSGVVEIHFAHAPSAPIDVYEELTGCKVRFGTDCYRLIMADNIMNRPLPTANAHQLNILKAKQDVILSTFNETNNLITRVEGAILTIIRDQKPTVDIVANILGFSVRTMKRHLKDQSTTYREILERVKQRMCNELLDDGMKLAKIAQTLWYSDQAAFTRAYKRWHGVTPSRRGK